MGWGADGLGEPRARGTMGWGTMGWGTTGWRDDGMEGRWAGGTTGWGDHVLGGPRAGGAMSWGDHWLGVQDSRAGLSSTALHTETRHSCDVHTLYLFLSF